ncbi:hypothetical protein BpHYR1_036524 [Brachionus plicatilis]|uniref:Uncharacterized protein n=1 Tax=Brachionus plicatilis TaxID=10195 RepID=A0A3M7SC40_BRAPC|nr:hypothetical protein BpHYR1_036524 [Brachionus plicatilis]
MFNTFLLSSPLAISTSFDSMPPIIKKLVKIYQFNVKISKIFFCKKRHLLQLKFKKKISIKKLKN